MPNNASETLIAANGSVWIAATGTSFPATVTTTPSGSWSELGFITPAGLKAKPSMSVAEFYAWQNNYPIRRVVTQRGLALGFVLQQWNEVTIPLAFGGGAITGSGPYTFTPAQINDTLYERALLVRWKDGSRNYDLRVLRVMPTDLSEIALARTAMTELAIALMMYDDGDDTTAPFTIVTDDTNFA